MKPKRELILPISMEMAAADVIGRRPTVALPVCHRDIRSTIPRMRKEIGLPVGFTLEACRDGGMTELDEAGLTEGPGRARSAHRTHPE
jgi:hypothetical protein